MDAISLVMGTIYREKFKNYSLGFLSSFCGPGAENTKIYTANTRYRSKYQRDIRPGLMPTLRRSGNYMTPKGITHAVGVGSKGKQINRTLPLGSAEYDSASDDQFEPGPLEDEANPISPEERELKKLVDGGKNAWSKGVNLLQLWASQSIISGYQEGVIGTSDPDLVLDFGRSADLTRALTAGNHWNDPDINPLNDFDFMWDLHADHGYQGTMKITLGETAALHFFTNPLIKAATANNEIMPVKTTENGGAVAPGDWGYYQSIGKQIYRCWGYTPKGRVYHIYVDSSRYKADNDVITLYLPTNSFTVELPEHLETKITGGPGNLKKMNATRREWFMKEFGFDPLEPITYQDGDYSLVGETAANGVNVVDPRLFTHDATGIEAQSTQGTLQVSAVYEVLNPNTTSFVDDVADLT